MALPLGKNASTDKVNSAPANFSPSDFRPFSTGMAYSSLKVCSYKFSIFSASLTASSLLAKAVCPSCHKNSRLLKKGVQCLNSQRTTLHHWFNRRGRSLYERIHLA